MIRPPTRRTSSPAQRGKRPARFRARVLRAERKALPEHIGPATQVNGDRPGALEPTNRVTGFLQRCQRMISRARTGIVASRRDVQFGGVRCRQSAEKQAGNDGENPAMVGRYHTKHLIVQINRRARKTVRECGRGSDARVVGVDPIPLEVAVIAARIFDKLPPWAGHVEEGALFLAGQAQSLAR